MLVTGYAIRRALRRLERERAILVEQWDQVLYAFADEEKPSPEQLLHRLEAIEAQVAALQVAQARYNLAVTVTVRRPDGDQPMLLHEAVKRVGGIGRLEGLVGRAAKGEANYYYYGGQPRSRSSDEEHAVRQLSLERAAQLYAAYGEYAEALREAIAMGNETPIELNGLDPDLLE